MISKSELQIEGKRLEVSNLDKILYPEAKFTKAQVIDYYVRIAPALLPHLKDRPLTLKRYPEGVRGLFFYEKRCPPHRPSWVNTVSVWSEHKGSHIHYCLANDLATLVWAANLADLELHTSLSKKQNIECPTMVVFDLDPGPPANIIQCAEVACYLNEILDDLSLQSWIKTSGSKGLQVCIPLNSHVLYEETKTFAHEMAQILEQKYPKLIVSKMSKSLREGKVFVDWSQNDDHKTTVCAYSLRAKERPTVSTPLKWYEVAKAHKNENSEMLSFESEEVLKRVEKFGDLFEPVLKLKQKLPKKIKAHL